MDWAHHRQPRYYQGRSHGYYNQYHPNFNESSSWTLWRSPPPPAAYAQDRRRRWGGVLLGAAAFSVVLAVVVITGLAIYMGALKLDVTQYMVLDGSFRVVSGDFYNASLLDHSSDLFQRKSQIYKLMIESVLRRSDLSPAVKQCSILGFSNGSLVVFFRLILDRRKLPKKSVNIEEWLRTLLVQKIPAASPVKSFRIDKTQLLLRRLGDDSNHAASLEIENKNQTLQLHNGLLRKGPPQIVTTNYTTTPSSKTKVPKTLAPNIGIIEGSFKLSNPETSPKNHTITFSTNISQSIAETTTSSHDHQTVRNVHSTSDKMININKSSSKIDFYQHSPALNAFLNQRTTIERVTYPKGKVEPTEPILNYGETDLITLLPYTFQNKEEPWKPMLPENFTRYPERKPFPTEDYGSEGVGIVEVVVNPEDLTSSIPSTPFLPGVSFSVKPPVYLKTPNNMSYLFPIKKPIHPTYEDFGPRSDDKISDSLNDQSDKNDGEFEEYNKAFRDITNEDKNIIKIDRNNISFLGDTLPEFPIIQQFHDLDSLLRTYDSKNSNLNTSEIPVTLIPARSNLGMNRRIRPRPSQMPEEIAHQTDTYLEFGPTENLSEVIEDSFKIRGNIIQNKNNTNQFEIHSNKHKSKIANNVNQTAYKENVNTLYIQTQVSSKLVEEDGFHIPIFPNDSLANHEQEDLLGIETTTQSDTVHYVEISKTVGNEEESHDFNAEYTTEKDEKWLGEEVEFVEVPSTSEPLVDMSSRSQRNSVIPYKTSDEDRSLKFDLQEDSNIDFSVSSGNPKNTNTTSTNTSKATNEPFFFMKLKDTKLQELLEKIIYNLTVDNSIGQPKVASKDHNTSSVKFPYSLNNYSNYGDVTVAQNRKYGQSYSDSKNSLMKNSSVFNMKPDVILYYLKNPSKINDSFENLKEENKSNTTIKNEQNSAVNKSSPNYVLNKNGFLMLTKVLNKVSTNGLSNKEFLVKSNLTGNHTSSDCLGNINIKCGSGECISSLSRCNNLVDCVDGSDEKNCTCAEFLRAQYLTRKICDGVVDCWDFSDENSCEWCSSNQYVCSNSRVCVDRVRLCNGELDCPNGDDEKNCVSIAPKLTQSDMMSYYSSGILMIRKEGSWGKLCTQNFETLSSIFKSRWTLEDLGKVVCKTMTFRFFTSIEHINDTSKDEDRQNKFYELLYSKETAQLKSPRLGLTFGDTNCVEKKVVRITCSNLECGVRPQANFQWGRRSKRLSGSRHSRIVGGGNAGPGSWPWLAALYKEGEFQCGATLISDRWLLSAGHCFYHSLDDYWVARLGALRRGTNLPSPYEQLRVVSRILLHPNYIDAGFVNDISLLQMEQPVSLTNYVRPICLPQTSTVLQDGKMCTVIGWGQLFEVGRIFPDTLQEVQLPVISTSECRKRTLFLPLYKVTENMFCAGYDRGGRDACLGDSGGPLMCQENDGRWSLMGVTSNGYGCARANRPGVYTKVANYISWVHSSMANDGTSMDKHPKGRNTSCHGHRCPLGECLPPARICNGFMECSDGSDEKDCW